MSEGKWLKKSWGEIALELARRAAYLNRYFPPESMGVSEEQHPTQFVTYEALLKKCEENPDKGDWTWVYYPLLEKLLGSPCPARLITIGQFHKPGSSQQAHRHWLNYLGAGMSQESTSVVVHLASMLSLEKVGDKQVRFSEFVGLTTDLAEEVNSQKPAIANNANHQDEALLSPVALFLGDALPGGVPEQIPLRLPPINALSNSTVPSNLNKIDPADVYAPVDLAAAPWLADYLPGIGTRASQLKIVTDQIVGERLKAVIRSEAWGEDRVRRGAVWLGDICKAVGANCVMAIPAWLPPSRSSGSGDDDVGIQSGTLVLYVGKKFPWGELHDIVSAYHSGGLMYLGKSEQQHISRLAKHRQMFELLASPLGNITDALANLQRDTQELRAVLYDPAKAIFESHSRINELFREGHEVRISPDIRIIVAHVPDRYCENRPFQDDKVSDQNLSQESAVICAITAVCRIFGFEDKLRYAHNLEELRGAAKHALKRASEKAFDQLRTDILWLWEKALCSNKLTQMEDFAGISADDAKKFLSILKKVCFSPFKISEGTWDCLAIELALRPFLNKTGVIFQNFTGMAATQHELCVGRRSPATYGAILNFLIDVSVSKSSRRPTACNVVRSGSDPNYGYTICLAFNDTFSCGPNGEDLDDLRKMISPVLGGLRDWRVTGANAGNFYGPFIDLANRLHGVAEAEGDGCPAGYWCSQTCGSNEVIHLKTKSSHEFVVSLSDENSSGKLTIEWK